MCVKCILPHNDFYIEKLGFAGVYLMFLFLIQYIDCGYSLEPPRRNGRQKTDSIGHINEVSRSKTCGNLIQCCKPILYFLFSVCLKVDQSSKMLSISSKART